MRKVVSLQKAITICAIVLIIAGVFVVSSRPLQNAVAQHEGALQNPELLRAVEKQVTPDPLQLDKPVSLRVPRLGIFLNIESGYYNATKAVWTLDKRHAFFMMPHNGRSPATPTIYGHNSPGIFRALEGAAQGELLEVTLQDAKTYTFAYAKDVTVKPEQVDILELHSPDSIHILTCTGHSFGERRIMQFEYLGKNPEPIARQR